MPRKARAAAASARNGSMSGKGREVKRQKLESHWQEMGMTEDKEVSRFFTMDIVYASYLIRKNPAREPKQERAPVEPLRVFEDLQNKFRCHVPRGSLHPSHCSNLGQQFSEFHINIDPDPEDFGDIFEKGDFEPIPELSLPTEDEFSEDEITNYGEDPEIPRSGDGTTQAIQTVPQIPLALAREGRLREPLTILQAKPALDDLTTLLHPRRKNSPGHIDPEINHFVRTRMEGMKTMLNFYTNPHSMTYGKWGVSSYQAAISLGRGRHCARQLCILVRQFIKDRKVLPINPYGQWNESLLVDEDLANEINIYLQSIGPEISGQKLMDFINNNTALRSRHEIEKKIGIKTAQRYLNALGYRYRTPLKGQYADGHEREDVVYYRDQIFLPKWRGISERMFNWAEGDLPEFGPLVGRGRRVITWFHDESVFYAHDRRKKSWYHKDAAAKPYAKGDGHSLMVADYVSADFGWLRSSSPASDSGGERSARRILRPGVGRDGYSILHE
jgi:hypothetical protein